MKNHDAFSTSIKEELLSVAPATEVDSLVRIASYLTNAPQPVRSSNTHRAAWYAISSHISDQKPRRLFNWKIALVPAMAILGILVLPFVSQNALPGDTTYSIKLATEEVQIATALSPAKKANLCSVQMKMRADELAKLSTQDISTDTVRSLTASIIKEANEFNDYAKKSGDHRATLEQQRQRDVSYVLDALNKANTNLNNDQKSIVSNTKSTLQSGMSVN